MSITATKRKKDGLTQYRVRVSYKTPEGYKVKERKVYGLQNAKETEVALQNDEPLEEETPAPKVITVGELAKMYSDSRIGQIRKVTIEKADRIIRVHVLPYFASADIRTLSLPVLAKWKAEIAKKDLALVTKQNIYVAFSALLNFAVKMELLDKNNLKSLGNFRDSGDAPEESKIRFYTPDEFKRFMAALPSKTFVQRKIYCFYMMAYFTGARKGEINALKWTDLEGDILHISRSVTQQIKGIPFAETATKNKTSKRNIRLPKPLMDYLKEHRKISESFPNFSEDWRICGGDTIVNDNKLWEAKKRAAGAAGLHEISVHDFRHSHATYLLNAGVNIKEVSRRLGHASVEMTWNVYAHLYPAQEEKAIAALNEITF